MNSFSQIFKKDHLRIIITDSGLGGLSVQAKLDNELNNSKIDKNVELIYFNSFAGEGLGYNEVSDPAEKIRIFNSALDGMTKYNPDLILIACNTLSALYPSTELAKSADIPVYGIIDLGVELILENIKDSNESKILLLGTETTIKSEEYQNKLVSNGIDPQKIFAQGCKYLEDEIQIDPFGEKVRELIEKYIDEALQNFYVGGNEELIVVLCCSHYGYSKNIFRDALTKKLGKTVTILNPNDKMVAITSQLVKQNNSGYGEITNTVVSRVKLKEYQIKKLGILLKKDSINLFESLKEYSYIENIFTL